MGTKNVLIVFICFFALSSVSGTIRNDFLDHFGPLLRFLYRAESGATTRHKSNINIKDDSKEAIDFDSKSSSYSDENDDDSSSDSIEDAKLSHIHSTRFKKSKSPWKNQGLIVDYTQIAKNGSTNILKQSNITMTDNSQYSTNIGNESSKNSKETFTGSEESDFFRDDFGSSEKSENKEEAESSTTTSNNKDSSSSEESRCLWDNRGLIGSYTQKAKNGSKTILQQTNENITDNSRHFTNISDISSPTSISSSTSNSMHRDSSSSEKSECVWDNRDAIISLTQEAENGSTTIVDQRNVNLSDNSHHLTNIWYKSSSEKHELKSATSKSKHRDSFRSKKRSGWDNRRRIFDFIQKAKKGSTTISRQNNINITDNSQHLTNIDIISSSKKDEFESSTSETEETDSSSSEESGSFLDIVSIINIIRETENGSNTINTQNNINLLSNSHSETNIHLPAAFSHNNEDDEPSK